MSSRLRLRFTFSKKGWLVYSSHLDLMRLWERALRRAGLPLAYSGGYNPRPKLQLARALPLGHAGEQEILDVWLEGAASPAAVTKATTPVLPEGLTIHQVHQVDPRAPAMQTRVVGTVYRVEVEWDKGQEEVKARIQEVLSADELPHRRRGKRYDLRPLIESLRLADVGDGVVTLRMELSARPGATGRPEAVLEVLGMGESFARHTRERLVLSPERGEEAEGKPSPESDDG